MTRRSLLRRAAALAGSTVLSSGVARAAVPYDLYRGPLPSARQLAWHKLEFYGFLHFTVNTFTDKEWGEGDEDPAIFQPTNFDADQMVEGLASAGMKGVILTCKHHDGFCLWPTKTTEHSVRNSPWRRGKGDVVKDVSEAARRRGLKFGVYLSPWDRNSALYGTPAYIPFYRHQLTELLTDYGPIFEVWHDGANGGTGFYGGAREKRTIDKRTYYDWQGTWELTRSLQPDAVIFSDAGPDVRWVGNEKGIAGDPCWETFTPVANDGGAGVPGDTREAENNSGTLHGKYWMPAECDVSIRPGWFWHEKENDQVRTAEQLWDLYLKSVGRGASFLLNVPPTREGRLDVADLASLKDFGWMLNQLRPSQVIATKSILELSPDKPFNLIRIREDVQRGQRIQAAEVEVLQDGNRWNQISSVTSIGACRLVSLPESCSAAKVRLRVTISDGEPQLAELAVFAV